MKSTEREFEQRARSTLPVCEFIDPSVVGVSDGLYQCFVPLTRNTGNHINTVHATFQWASAEILGGLIVLSKQEEKKYVPVAKSLTIDFKRPAPSRITSEALFSE